MPAVYPGAYVVCSCTIPSTNSSYNQWNFSNGLCETTIGSTIQLKCTGKQCSIDNQFCGPFIRAWNEPSNSSELLACETTTILIHASHALDGQCQDGTNGTNGTPTSYGRTVLSVTCTFHVTCCILSTVLYWMQWAFKFQFNISTFLTAAALENPLITNEDSDNPTVLTIEWSPAENGSCPNSFNVAISKYGISDPLNSASVALEDGRLLPYLYTFTGFICGTHYNVSVIAINCAGISSFVYQAGIKTGDWWKCMWQELTEKGQAIAGGVLTLSWVCVVRTTRRWAHGAHFNSYTDQFNLLV